MMFSASMSRSASETKIPGHQRGIPSRRSRSVGRSRDYSASRHAPPAKQVEVLFKSSNNLIGAPPYARLHISRMLTSEPSTSDRPLGRPRTAGGPGWLLSSTPSVRTGSLFLPTGLDSSLPGLLQDFRWPEPDG